MKDYDVSMSVVTCNSGRDIAALLQSLIENVKGISYHVFVIDNASTDYTVAVAEQFMNDRIELIRLDRNIGFGAAHNLVLDRVSSKYHVVINPDIELNNDVIADMSHYLDTNKNIVMISPKVLGLDGKLQILPKRDPKMIYLISRRIGVGFLGRYRKEYEMDECDPNSIFDIQFATGCFMFMRTEFLKKIGGFDERYFLYFEDADLSRAIRKYGRIEYNPYFVVRHRWERGGAKHFKLMMIQIMSMLKYRKKWGIGRDNS